MSGLKILIADGNTEAANTEIKKFGGLTGAERHGDDVRRIAPDAEIIYIHPADHDVTLPAGTQLTDFDGLILGGSALHVYDDDPEVTRQIELVRSALESGLPVLGTCWGLQVGAVATGGAVAASPRGREVGVARKVALSAHGVAHPLFAGKRTVFDSPCIHFDEVTHLPSDSLILAGNHHSAVQAAVIHYGKSVLWGVQYHPEYTVGHLATLYRRYASGLIDGGFFQNHDDLDRYAGNLDILHRDPTRHDLRWRLGIDDDLLTPEIRCREIENWLMSLRS